jgi:ribosomal protein L37E
MTDNTYAACQTCGRQTLNRAPVTCTPCRQGQGLDHPARRVWPDADTVTYRRQSLADVLRPVGEANGTYRVKLTAAAGQTHWLSISSAEAHALARVLTGGDA